MLSKERLNLAAWERVGEYANLPIHQEQVPVPYYISVSERMWTELMHRAQIPAEQIRQVKAEFHNRQIPFAWYRGKGTPQEIAEATIKVSQTMGLPLDHASADTIREFMKLYGLGIDCSGLVYQTLYHAFSAQDQLPTLQENLNWQDPKKRTVYQAGAFVFAGSETTIVSPDQIEPLDLLIFHSRVQGINHVALFLEGDGDLVVIQSTIAIPQTGINASRYHCEDGQPQFEFHPEIGPTWELLYQEGRLEFHRLNCLSK